jgi:hypothetical protein
MATPEEIYIQSKEFYYDDKSIVDGMSLDEFIDVIKSKFDFSDPNYKHKITQYKCMRDGGDYHDDYEEVDNLEFITYRYETEEERIIRENEEKRREEERIEKAHIDYLERQRQSIEWSKKDSIDQIKKYYEKASEYYTKDELKEILGL